MLKPQTAISEDFSTLDLNPELLLSLANLHYTRMTPIQAQSLPVLLSGTDVIARAHTGSGKTAAFALTILNRLNLKFFAAQALILCPTRELALQVSQAIRELARAMPNVKVVLLAGGSPMHAQLDSLRHGGHIIVGTPGRIQKHLDQESLDLKHLQLLVLDEADRMLDMGFLEAIQNIVKKCPQERQTLLFSATYPAEIQALSRAFMREPKEIFIEQAQVSEDLQQMFYEVDQDQQFSALTTILNYYRASATLIFCNTKKRITEVVNQLNRRGFCALSLHGDMEQMDRDLAMVQFANQSCAILVATDVAARGLDIKALPLVINYELAFDCEVHTHRIGRTARAGQSGLAISLITQEDAYRVLAIENAQAKPVSIGKIAALVNKSSAPSAPKMITLCLNIGRKHKLRAGDILGALTKDAGLSKEMIGKIDLLATRSYVAIQPDQAKKACEHLNGGKVKGQRVNATLLYLASSAG